MTHFGLGRYITRDGHTAVILGTVQGVKTLWPLVGYVIDDDGEGQVPCCWSCAGLAGLPFDIDPFDLEQPLEQTGCPCCDPTSSGEEPVVVRLERECEDLRQRLASAHDAHAARDLLIEHLTARLAAAEALLREACECSREVCDAFGGEPIVTYDGSHIPRSWFVQAEAAKGGRDE